MLSLKGRLQKPSVLLKGNQPKVLAGRGAWRLGGGCSSLGEFRALAALELVPMMWHHQGTWELKASSSRFLHLGQCSPFLLIWLPGALCLPGRVAMAGLTWPLPLLMIGGRTGAGLSEGWAVILWNTGPKGCRAGLAVDLISSGGSW